MPVQGSTHMLAGHTAGWHHLVTALTVLEVFERRPGYAEEQ